MGGVTMIDAKELARSGCKYIGTPYSKIDCQKLWEKMLSDCGISMDLGGSNSWYRYFMEHGWVGTPEECKKRYGSIPQAATLFIREDVSESTPEQFRNDGIGDITHMGDYTAMSGSEMCNIAKEAGVENANEYNFGNGAIHSSSSKEHVCTSKFEGKTIPNGGWNRVGLLPGMINYDGINPDPEPEPEPEPEPQEPIIAVVWSENGKPVNTRKGPDESYPLSKAGKIPVGSTVEIIDTTVNKEGETWCRIRWEAPGNVVWYCWMKNDFLIRSDDQQSSDAIYTVHIPFLTSYAADALIKQYPGSWKTEDKAVG